VLFSPSAGEPGNRFSWAATANTYFTCTLAPLNASGTGPAENLSEVSGVDLDGSAATRDDATLRFVTRGEILAPSASLDYQAQVFLGEKDGDAFRAHPFYRDRNYYYQIAQSFGWCTFNFLVELMIWLLNAIFRLIPNYGVAIIFLVLIVRTLLHPITKKGQVNMARMQKQMGDLAPRMEELKKKYGNDKARLQQETMKLYRELGVSPATQFLTCLPMVCQMPIWVALWLSLSNNIRMRHEPFLWWIQDLTAQDALFTFSTPLVVPLFGWTIPSFNLLPLLMAATMYFQQKLQPKPNPNPNLTAQQREQQEMMQKMMPMMCIMMLVLFYKMPSGLTLYITASNFFGTIEQWRIRKHIREKEEAGALAVRPPAPRDSKPAGPKPSGSRPTDLKPKPKSALAQWFERLQKKAAETQKLQRSQPRAKNRR
jgi:YidC/Oxa1 family membrane protein insertase